MFNIVLQPVIAGFCYSNS